MTGTVKALEPQALSAAIEKAAELTSSGGMPVPVYVDGIIRAYLSALTASASEPEPVAALQQLNDIAAMLDEGQGDDDGMQILPDFEPGISTLAKVEKCLFLLEKRRDVIEAYGDERLFAADAYMADGEIKMTAAEDVLAWLLIEKVGVPDDCNYTPNQAQEIIACRLDMLAAHENAALANPVPTPDEAVEAATHEHAWIVGNGDGKRWRTWADGSPEWTEDREQATRFARRIDAEAVHREDDDAWRVVAYKDLPNDADEAYEIGVRDGYEDAIQTLDVATGGDGEFRGSTIPGRAVDVPTMQQQIIDRFAALSHPADGWRDIETAPRDGSQILSVQSHAGKLHDPAIVRWCAQDDEWWNDDADQFAHPNLWMPLPAAPLAAKPEGE